MNAPFGTVTAVIPNWNRAALLCRALDCLKAQTYPLEQILVVDNGSTDNSREVVRQSGAEWIGLEQNFGFAAAVNHGLRRAQTDWILVLNNDVEVPAAWLSTLVEIATAANAAFATGKLLQTADPSLVDGTFDLVCRGALAWRCGNGRPDGPRWSEPRRIDFVSFTAVLLSGYAIREAGCLDERFGSYLEDCDWSLRCAAKGLTGVYVPDAVGHHMGSATLGAWRKNTVWLLSRNQILLAAKHFRGSPRLPRAVARLLWLGMAMKHRQLVAAARGFAAGWWLCRRFRDQPSTWPRVRNAIARSEDLIRAYQAGAGADTFWRLYFLLTR